MLGEWWASEVVTIAAGRLPQPQESLAAMSIFQQTNALSFMLPLGLSIAVGIRSANVLPLTDCLRQSASNIPQTQSCVIKSFHVLLSLHVEEHDWKIRQVLLQIFSKSLQCRLCYQKYSVLACAAFGLDLAAGFYDVLSPNLPRQTLLEVQSLLKSLIELHTPSGSGAKYEICWHTVQ